MADIPKEIVVEKKASEVEIATLQQLEKMNQTMEGIRDALFKLCGVPSTLFEAGMVKKEEFS